MVFVDLIGFVIKKQNVTIVNSKLLPWINYTIIFAFTETFEFWKYLQKKTTDKQNTTFAN